MKHVIIGGLTVFMCTAAILGYLVFSGPRMTDQAHLLAYEREAPPPAPGTVPAAMEETLPAAYQAEVLASPLKPSGDALAAGKAYYGYYCAFCHGDAGRGDGPVGESYVPAPADISTAKVKAMPADDLARAMLSGTGHEPVLARVIPREYVPYIVLYVQSLGSGPAASNTGDAHAGAPGVDRREE